jgi:hypothetical protein
MQGSGPPSALHEEFSQLVAADDRQVGPVLLSLQDRRLQLLAKKAAPST